MIEFRTTGGAAAVDEHIRRDAVIRVGRAAHYVHPVAFEIQLQPTVYPMDVPADFVAANEALPSLARQLGTVQKMALGEFRDKVVALKIEVRSVVKEVVRPEAICLQVGEIRASHVCELASKPVGQARKPDVVVLPGPGIGAKLARVCRLGPD
jgi:hypothetical protein